MQNNTTTNVDDILKQGRPEVAFPATLAVDYHTWDDSGNSMTIPKGTRIAVIQLPGHYVTNSAGVTEYCPAGVYCGTPDGKFWIELKFWQFSAEN